MVHHRAVVAIQVSLSPIAALFHRLLTRPVIELDGRENAGKWGSQEIPVDPGDHHLSVFFRYRGQNGARLAEADTRFVTRDATRRVDITAHLGPRNGSRFRIGEPVIS
ncbi:hypothetical protein [Streptomyces sp. YS-3]|uniref:hypothetical protein n=1 Tax=Streptomyces sp. YS-3 TaxID=3381352 RepID=UPI00386251F2